MWRNTCMPIAILALVLSPTWIYFWTAHVGLRSGSSGASSKNINIPPKTHVIFQQIFIQCNRSCNTKQNYALLITINYSAPKTLSIPFTHNINRELHAFVKTIFFKTFPSGKFSFVSRDLCYEIDPYSQRW